MNTTGEGTEANTFRIYYTEWTSSIYNWKPLIFHIIIVINMGQKVNLQCCILKHIYNVRYTTILCNVCKHFVKFQKTQQPNLTTSAQWH